jgi:hypothetical protein
VHHIDHIVQAHHAIGLKGVDHLLPYFHIVLPISNPVRYSSRYILFLDFVERLRSCGIEPWVVEVQQGLRAFAVTDANNPRHIQLRTEEELWFKEVMLNIGIRRLPSDWKYVAWIDTDIQFQRPDWIAETLHRLQDVHVLQLFQTAIDLGPTGEALHIHKGFFYSYLEGLVFSRKYGGWHPGYAWACTREAYDWLGGLFDIGILGAGDDHMAKALIGRGIDSLPNGLHPNYKDALLAWESRAEKYVKRDVGFVPGTITHSWHGKKKDRKYWDRWEILKQHQYDPYKHIWRDANGLYRLDEDCRCLRDGIRNYFRSRHENSIDLE